MTDTIENVSTVLNTAEETSSAGNGAPQLAETYEDNSIQGVLAAEAKRLRDEAEPTKTEPVKVEKEEKAAKPETVKAEKPAKVEAEPVKAEADLGQKADDDADGQPKRRSPEELQREEERRKYSVLANKFTPEARAKWDNVPHPVKAEMFRIEQERDAEVQKYRQSHERYESIREFDEMARRNGRDLPDTLQKITQFENAMARSPIAALEMALQMAGPRKNDGSPLSLYEVAQYVVQQGPQSVQNAASQYGMHQPQRQQAQQPQINPDQIKEQIRLEMSAEQIVERFGQQHPDFSELSSQIKGILDSGVINQLYGNGLTLEQKLAEAYRMAGGQPSSINGHAAEAAHSEHEARPVNPDAGKKSVRGAPAGNEDATTFDKETDVRETLRKELRKFKAA